MIEMLIKDNDTHITDIIREAFGSNESSFRTSPDLINEDSTISKENTDAIRTIPLDSSTITSHKKEARVAPSDCYFLQTTNVWQERAAKREMRKSKFFI